MKINKRLFILNHEDYWERVKPELADAVSGAGGDLAEPAHGRLIIEADAEASDAVLAALRAAEEDGNADLTGMRTYDLPEPSGKHLIVNFMYRETHQVCSASVDERLWAAIVGPDEENVDDAFSALYSDVEIFPSYVPGRDIIVQDVMNEVRFWSAARAFEEDPALRDQAPQGPS